MTNEISVVWRNS